VALTMHETLSMQITALTYMQCNIRISRRWQYYFYLL